MKPERILIVESDRESAETLARTFAGIGYRFEVVSTGAEAVTRVEENPFTVAIISEHLVDSDGIDCFHRLRRRCHGLVGLLLVSHGDVNSVFSAIRFGISHVLPKPIDVAELVRVVAEAGGGRARSLARA